MRHLTRIVNPASRLCLGQEIPIIMTHFADWSGIMSDKDFGSLSKGAKPQQPYSKNIRRNRPKVSRREGSAVVSVRPPSAVPKQVKEFFRIDPRTRVPYRPEESLFFAQVLLHEIDEGARLLRRLGFRRDSQAISDFDNALSLNQRLELMRTLLSRPDLDEIGPERVRGSHKARNNQIGAAKYTLGRHAAVAVTDAGIDYKPRNEDGFLMMPDQKVLGLSDGMGGHVAGHIAAGIAIDFFEAGIRRSMELEEALTYANEAIRARVHNDPRLNGMHPMGCTFAAVQIKHTRLKTAHVGDTKVMVLRNAKIVFQTLDHTQGQELLREGLVDPSTALELNHVLNRCIGLDRMHPQRDVSMAQVELEPGDRVLLATDGVTDNFFDSNFSLNELAELASSGNLAHAAERTIDECHTRMRNKRLPNGRAAKCDNLSLAMLEFRG